MKTEKLLTNIYAITSRRKNLGGSLKYGAGPRALNWRALCTLLARLQWRRWRSSWITMVVMRSFTDHNGELIACCWAGPYGFHGDDALHAYSWDCLRRWTFPADHDVGDVILLPVTTSAMYLLTGCDVNPRTTLLDPQQGLTRLVSKPLERQLHLFLSNHVGITKWDLDSFDFD